MLIKAITLFRLRAVGDFLFVFYFTLLLLFSHLADAFIQSDLQIRKSNYNYKLKLYKY